MCLLRLEHFYNTAIDLLDIEYSLIFSNKSEKNITNSNDIPDLCSGISIGSIK